MEFRKVQMPCRDVNQLYPAVKSKALQLYEACRKAGILITITQTYRSIEYQNELYAKGRTAPGKIVTNCKGGTSPHNYRVAFDICINVKGKAYDEAMLNKAGEIGKKLGLTWGGDFIKIKDRPHFQYYGGLTLGQIKNGRMPI